MQPNSRQYLWDILLYSGLGCFSYFFLVRFADIPLRYQDRLLTPEAFVAVMLLFNGVGLGMRYIQLRLPQLSDVPRQPSADGTILCLVGRLSFLAQLPVAGICKALA